MRGKQTAPWHRVMSTVMTGYYGQWRVVKLVSSARPRCACGPRQPYHRIAVWRVTVLECKTLSNCESDSHTPQVFIITCSTGRNNTSSNEYQQTLAEQIVMSKAVPTNDSIHLNPPLQKNLFNVFSSLKQTLLKERAPLPFR